MPDPKPRAPIRRFDVFADYNRLKNEAAGLPEARAKGDAIWLAKVVAGRRFGSASATATPPRDEDHGAARTAEGGAEGFRSAGVPTPFFPFDADAAAFGRRTTWVCVGVF